MNYFRQVKETFNPYDEEWQSAIWHYNYNGYLCLVEFCGGRLHNPNSEPLRTLKDKPSEYKEEICKKLLVL